MRSPSKREKSKNRCCKLWIGTLQHRLMCKEISIDEVCKDCQSDLYDYHYETQEMYHGITFRSDIDPFEDPT